MKIRKTVLVLVLATCLLGLGLQASAAVPAAASGGVNLLAHYSSIPLLEDAKAILTSKGASTKGYHLPQGNFVGAKMVLKDGSSLAAQPVSHTQKAIAIVFDFAAPDAEHPADICPGTELYAPVPVSYFRDLLFGTTYDPYQLADFAKYATYGGNAAPTNRTLKNYLAEVSSGWISSFTGDVVRVTLPHPYSYYAIGQKYGVANVQNDNADYTMALIEYDAVKAADAVVDFSQYAAPGQALDNVFLIHAGTGAEYTGQGDLIWSHSWEYASSYCYYMYASTGDSSWITDDSKYDPNLGIPVDGVRVNHYSIEPEVGGDLTNFLKNGVTGPYPPYVGVYAHEYSHVLGVPDQYDYGYESEGTGIYSLMSSGSWTRYPNNVAYSGNTPVMLDAWSRLYLGYQTPVETVSALHSSKSYTLQPASVGGGILKLVVPGTNGSEYFLVENRQQVAGTFDMGLNRSNSALGIVGTNVRGLAIYHVDENVLARNFDRPDEAPATSTKTQWNMSVDKANGEWHYGVSILQADGLWWLEKGTWYYGNANLYRTGSSFTPKSYPASSSYYTNFAAYSKGLSPNYSGVFVKNVVENADGTVTFLAGIE